MTLRRQLFWGISLIFCFLFVGLVVQSVLSTRNYLQQQLGSHAQDAATSLSRGLSEALARNDRVLAETQVASFFDRGYFRSIQVLSTQKQALVTRVLPTRIEGVPEWFSKFASLDAPAGESLLSSGWKQLGRVVVISQPTFANQYLWQSALEVTALMGGSFLLSMLLTHLFLRLILKPLQRIEDAAKAICERHFEPISPMPETRELRSVVLAMNDASRRISGMLDAESLRADGYRKEAYEDGVTGMDNRRSFDLRLAQALRDEAINTEAVLAVLEIDGLKNYNLIHGHRAGDDLLAYVADAVRTDLGNGGVILARIGGASFAIVSLDLPIGDLKTRLDTLLHHLANHYLDPIASGLLAFQIGAALCAREEQPGHALGRADLALETARQNGGNRVEVMAEDGLGAVSLGSTDWRTTIDHALTEGRWALLAQPVSAIKKGGLLHHEVMGRLIDDHGNLLQASHFIPMAQRHHFMARVDRTLIASILKRLSNLPDGFEHLAINLSPQAISNTDFRQWLAGELLALRDVAGTLSFEISEIACLRMPAEAQAIKSVLHAHGARLGIDHFGLDPQALNALRTLLPDYIKLDGGLSREAADPNARQILASIVQLAHSLDIQVIAQHVESEADLIWLRADGVDGAQGYYFGKPEEM